jgi:hypothetical protein
LVVTAMAYEQLPGSFASLRMTAIVIRTFKGQLIDLPDDAPPLTCSSHRRSLDSLQFGLLVRVEVVLGFLRQDISDPLLRRLLKRVRTFRFPVAAPRAHGQLRSAKDFAKML